MTEIEVRGVGLPLHLDYAALAAIERRASKPVGAVFDECKALSTGATEIVLSVAIVAGRRAEGLEPLTGKAVRKTVLEALSRPGLRKVATLLMDLIARASDPELDDQARDEARERERVRLEEEELEGGKDVGEPSEIAA